MAPALADDDLCPWWIFGATAGDQFEPGSSAGFGDLDADGHLDVPGTSL